MYKVIGADGKEYGPISLDQLKQWVAEKRVAPQSQVQDAATGQWKPAGQVPELAGLFPPPAPVVQPLSAATPAAPVPARPPTQGLAITSLVLGISSVALCLSALAGIPAVICGNSLAGSHGGFSRWARGDGFLWLERQLR